MRSTTKMPNFRTAVCQLFLVFVSLLVSYGEGYRVGDNPNHRADFLDSRERYHVQWMARNGRITFNVTVHTKGWILFGFANNDEEKTGQDLILGGVGANDQPYFSDRHTGRYNDRLEVDNIQDYTLEDSWETPTHTFLSFSRDLETCDHQDYPITENKVTLIWGYGDQDSEHGDGERDGGNRGSYDAYLLDPEYSPRVIRSNLFDQVPRVSGREAPTTQVWTIKQTSRLSRNDTSYMCRIHKAPRLKRKHHVIGFDVNFPNEESEQYVHHLLVHRCHVPRGSSSYRLFESFVQSGEEQICYSIRRPAAGNMPTHLCQQVYMVWGIGGRQYFTPDHVGFPFGVEEDEYYMTDVHYDNPEKKSNLRVTINIDLFYTRRLRPNDAGIMYFGHDVPGLPLSTIVPPQSPSVRMFGHCGGECTRRWLPKEGITLVAAFLHSHISGKQLRVHHFRGNEELPWILYDDNFSNYFQQIRALPRGETQIYPGDQVTMDCTHDNTWTNGTVLGGYPTRQEMCATYVVYYNLISHFTFCNSQIVSPSDRQFVFAGVNNITWLESHLDWVAISPSPSHLVGKTLTEISDDFIDWGDLETRNELQELKLQLTQTTQCGRDLHARTPQQIQRLIRLQKQIADDHPGLVISGDVPTDVDTQDDYAGPVNYPNPSDVIPYAIAETSCLQKGYFPKARN